MIVEKDVLQLFIQSIHQRIETLVDAGEDSEIIEGFKLLLSDNISENGTIHIRKSLMNKIFHLSFSNYRAFMHKYEKKHLQN
ncbi:ATP-dependent exoDNAse (exonuclease V) beta subunit [Candidatus Scalindua japonica]|uniref:ATP-dependent exoDNAse (Exonuclease V) beta subunit n=2 Tax=Candidatus Scalindua japonica TaxID=1284222 RepID=A0A286TV98_9BACT|nr:ATP-dependent exonuclease V beta subunit [Candidatus Scalindua japonica]GAX60090.1 ATP-dependent exoDNAse (exonuclease V) beta subunit [Candidatus Scalindua japonica]